MKKILLSLTATFAVCLAVFAGTNMCVKKQNGDILRINVDDVYEVYFEDIFNPDTSSIIPPLIDPSVADVSAYAPLRFEITSDSTVELTRGENWDSYEGLDSVNIPAKVKIDGKVYSVTSIGENAFSWCRNITSINIPQSITQIGNHAFWLCSSLTKINIPQSITQIGNYAFDACDKLNPELLIYDNGTKCFGWIGDSLKCVEVVIPEGVKSIDRDAFWGCKNLTKIFIPSSVTEIGSRAFAYCDTLDITIDNNEYSVNVGYDAFEDVHSVSFKDAIEANGIRFYLLTDSTLIVDTIKTNASVVIIPSEVFSNGKRYDVTKINNVAALEKDYLEIVEIPSSVTHIGSGAFYECINLNVIIDNSKDNVEVGNDAFFGVKSVTWLKEIDEDPSVADVSAYAPLRFEITSDSTVELTDGNYYRLDSVNIPAKVKIDGKVYSVTEIGERAFYSCSSLTSVAIPSSVTSIGSDAFRDCNRLTSIEIPSSVTSIGSDAFGNCSSLESINVDAKNPNYSSLDGILYNKDKTEIIKVPEGIKGSFSIPSRSFSIPSSVTSIGEGAFYGCWSLTSIEIPSSVTSIGSYAFRDCSSLESINVDAKNPNYSSLDGVVYNKEKTEIIAVPEGIKGSISIPSSVTEIGERAFYSCSSLTSVEIPSSVTEIGSEAFRFCSSLTSVEIPSSVTSIGDDAFVSCHSLTSVEIPSSVTSIGDDAFVGCSSLTSVEIPSSVTSIGSDAFGDCSSLESINVDAKNPNYSSLDGILYNKDKTEIIAVPKGIKGSFSIPSSVTSIGGYAFDGCSLTSVEIPSSVTSIGKYAFYYCRSLTSVEIPSSVTSIGGYAFAYCKNLDIVIDNSEENVKVDHGAFYGVKSVTWKK